MISIIVPVYNAELYLEKCIESIRCQSYKQLQIILVDDGSSDLSGKMCDEFAKKDERIVVIHQNNRGPVLARTTGIRYATGNYIGFVDADDYCEEKEYEEMLKDIEKYDADFVHYGYIKETGDSSMMISPTDQEECVTIDDPIDFISQRVLQSNHRASISPSMWSKLFKSELIKSTIEQIPSECRYGEDLINLILCSLKANKVVISSKAYYHYIWREGSLMNQTGNELDREARLYVWMRDTLSANGVLSGLQPTLSIYFERQLLSVFSKRKEDAYCIRRYGVKDPILYDNKKIVIYGAGNVGRDIFRQLSFRGKSNIVGVVDANADHIDVAWTNVSSVDFLKMNVYDYVIVAVFYESAFESIKLELVEQGVDEHKIVWGAPLNAI